MKRLISFIALIYCAMMAMAQYQDVKEKKWLVTTSRLLAKL